METATAYTPPFRRTEDKLNELAKTNSSYALPAVLLMMAELVLFLWVIDIVLWFAKDKQGLKQEFQRIATDMKETCVLKNAGDVMFILVATITLSCAAFFLGEFIEGVANDLGVTERPQIENVVPEAGIFDPKRFT